MTREKYIAKVSAAINDALRTDEELRYEAAIEGRIGLKEMTDLELAEFGEDCYGLVWKRDA